MLITIDVTEQTIFGYGKNYNCRITSRNGYNNFRIFRSPFGNCQLFSINSTNVILDRINSEQLYIFEKIKYLSANKVLAVVDVRKEYKKKVLRLKPIMINDYKSSNDSEMVMAIINIDTAIQCLKELKD